MGTGFPDFVTTVTATSLPTSKTQQHFNRLIILVYLSSGSDAHKIKPHSTQMTPCPDRPLLLLWWALDFVPSPLPTRFTWIPPFILIAIASIDDMQETHWVLCL